MGHRDFQRSIGFHFSQAQLEALQFLLKLLLSELRLRHALGIFGFLLAQILPKLDELTKSVLRSIPQSRAADGDVLPVEGVVLDEVERRRQYLSDFAQRAPPVVVIALQEHFCSGQLVDPLEIGHSILELQGPRDVARDEHEIIGMNERAPIGGDVLGMACPCRTEVVHVLVRNAEAQVKIADGPDAHGLIASIEASAFFYEFRFCVQFFRSIIDEFCLFPYTAFIGRSMASRWAFAFFSVCALAGPLFAQPINMQVVDGKANATKDGLQFTVDASDGAILHWDSFSIARGETTSFRLPSAEAAVLNRVVGLNPTEIHGQLLSNGSVYLLNPHGIFVGPEGLIHTGAFLGSTLDCANSDFLEGERLVFTQEGAGTIRNEGRIVTEHGDAILLASAIRNEGAIDAPAGAIALAAGAEMVLLPYGDEKIQIRLQLPSDPRDWESIGIHQAGELHALSIELASDGNLYGYAIKSDGVI